MRKRFLPALPVLCLVFLCLMAPSAARATSIVSDGTFSTYPDAWFTTQTDGNYPWTWGGGYASTGCIGAQCITGAPGNLGDLDQNLSTTSGLGYILSFQYSPGPGTANELEVLFGGTEVTDLVNLPDTTLTYTYDVTASSASTELTFLGRQDPSFDDLTDVSVSPIPEPSSLYLLGTGLVGLAGFVRRKLKA